MIFSNSSNHLLPTSYEYAGFEHHLNRRSIKKNDLTKNIKNTKLKDSVLKNIMRNTSNHTPVKISSFTLDFILQNPPNKRSTIEKSKKNFSKSEKCSFSKRQCKRNVITMFSHLEHTLFVWQWRLHFIEVYWMDRWFLATLLHPLYSTA